MKKKQNGTKLKQKLTKYEWMLLGMTALFLLFAFRTKEPPSVTVSSVSTLPPGGVSEPDSESDFKPDEKPGENQDLNNPGEQPNINPGENQDGQSGINNPGENLGENPGENIAENPGGNQDLNLNLNPAENMENAGNIENIENNANNSAADSKININMASADELESLPGIGPALAERIIAYRTEHGAFSRPEDLMNVSGIGQGKFDAVAALITV